MSLFKIDAPPIAAHTPGMSQLAHVITGNGYQLYAPVSYEVPLDGHNRDVPTDGSDKQFDIVTTNTTVVFQTYRGANAPLLLGVNPQALAKDAYDRGEDWAVERNIQTKVLNPKAVDLTPVAGTPVTNIRLALGLLEQYARDNSSFAPMLSGNALALLIVEDALDWNAPEPSTALGTRAVLAGGYGPTGPGSRAAGPGTAWLYISGQINLWKGSSDAETGPDLPNNRTLGLAEGSYASSVESFVAAVLVGTP